MWRITPLVQNSSFPTIQIGLSSLHVLTAFPWQLWMPSTTSKERSSTNLSAHWKRQAHYTSNSHSIFFLLAIHNNSIKEAARDILILQYVFVFPLILQTHLQFNYTASFVMIHHCLCWIHISIHIKCSNIIQNKKKISLTFLIKVVFHCPFILGSVGSG